MWMHAWHREVQVVGVKCCHVWDPIMCDDRHCTMGVCLCHQGLLFHHGWTLLLLEDAINVVRQSSGSMDV